MCDYLYNPIPSFIFSSLLPFVKGLSLEPIALKLNLLVMLKYLHMYSASWKPAYKAILLKFSWREDDGSILEHFRREYDFSSYYLQITNSHFPSVCLLFSTSATQPHIMANLKAPNMALNTSICSKYHIKNTFLDCFSENVIPIFKKVLFSPMNKAYHKFT